MTDHPQTRKPVSDDRQPLSAFLKDLYALRWAVHESGNRRLQAKARATLARLRRSLIGPRHEAEAYEFVLRHDPPRTQQDAWLLLAGLYALHPQPRSPTKSEPRTIGAAMGKLARVRGDSVTRRFTQLITVDRDALPHYLRQSVQLLRTESIALDYTQLLNDLIVLMGSQYLSDRAHRVRLEWARDYHRQLARINTAPPEPENP